MCAAKTSARRRFFHDANFSTRSEGDRTQIATSSHTHPLVDIIYIIGKWLNFGFCVQPRHFLRDLHVTTRKSLTQLTHRVQPNLLPLVPSLLLQRSYGPVQVC